MTWDDLTPADKEIVLWDVLNQIKLFRIPVPGDIELIARLVTESVDRNVEHAVDESPLEREFNAGHDAGYAAAIEVGRDEGYAQAVAELEALAEGAA